MSNCKHYAICGLDSIPGEDFCILHSQDPEKNKEEFDKALAAHSKKNPGKFSHFVFPGICDYFSGLTFDTEVDFSHATFTVSADFSNAIFTKRTNFMYAKFAGTAVANFTDAKFNDGADFTNSNFHNEARFSCVNFAGQADFSYVEFARQADFFGSTFAGETGFYEAAFGEARFCESTFCRARFSGARFDKEVNFFCATFNAQADFYEANFAVGADFSGVKFTREKEAIFRGTRFLGRTLFASRAEEGQTVPIFSGAAVDFREVIIEPLGALVFRNADLQQWRFLHTDLRKAEFTEVKWLRKRGRLRVYDEDVELPKGETRKWSHVERLYRELKQNYEDRRNFEQGGDFHYGEKEMRRRNCETPLGRRFLLWLYWLVSGYGERCLRPLGWAAVLLAATTAAYIWGGLLLPNKDISPVTNSTSILDVGLYGLRVMTLLKPNDFVPIGFCGGFVNMIQSIFGPLLFGLFALALRQRLKR
jgi:hypothetical protein